MSKSTVLIMCHLSSLLILDCISSIAPSNGEAPLRGEDSEAELQPCLSGMARFITKILAIHILKTQITGHTPD